MFYLVNTPFLKQLRGSENRTFSSDSVTFFPKKTSLCHCVKRADKQLVFSTCPVGNRVCLVKL